MQKIEADLGTLYEDKAEYEDDYRLITEPFGVRGSINTSRRSMSPGPSPGRGYGNESSVYPEAENNESEDDLRWVLYLSIIFLAI